MMHAVDSTYSNTCKRHLGSFDVPLRLSQARLGRQLPNRLAVCRQLSQSLWTMNNRH